ncbi:MAG TPA: PCMD domain-containing protein [Candidatus Prevotella avicola]|uniref:PCMD domain-containing protein n=1 Tax=Candidatus Prevotella avicola TaxID=2838738 RepID=A0A9D2JVP0_9BACT|nr:PCMD domain-containing protein [Candidatus Prevotella avicola]
MRLYMRFSHVLLVCAFCAMLTSCFKEEPLNAECDIEYAYLHSDDPEATFYQLTDSLVEVYSTDNVIEFGVKEDVDLTALAPEFVITEGATIEPASGSVHDFSDNKPVSYTVTSQDGKWSRTYMVYINHRIRTIDEIPTLSFENSMLDTSQRYAVWYETAADGYEINAWATGNPGFAITAGDAAPSEYPSSVLEDGFQGQGVCLVTRDTGPLGSSPFVRMPIAAGNLFTGTFNTSSALDALHATRFGTAVALMPLSFSGYYKYTSGGEVKDRDGNVIPGKMDTGDIYAVLYRNTDSEGNAFTLDGENVKTSDQIVATALIDEVKPTTEWTPFHINFTYKEQLDEQTLANYGYNLAIVFSSSIRGASFEGAVGSTLCIDEVTVTYETSE